MKDKKSDYVKCKCCGLLKDRLDISISLSILKNRDFVKNSDHKYDLFELLIGSDFKWACDTCINDRRALIPNSLQQTNFYTPYLSYYDTNLRCEKCKNEFTFTKDEKKLWYEQLKFHIKSIPLHCLKCRKEIRKLKIQNKILSQLLQKDQKDLTIDELSQIVQIYDEWNIKDKFNFYKKVIQKRIN
ncbi:MULTISPECIES: zinc-ribbon domain containing protein [unclassified Chryseobacterium]|uniref:zinc-ribbon domain containing protein n=1 Tax=unclassified Chryseobacterium TaxID=2593645 RepID=UPI002269B32C|nr:MULTISPECIES: zinc-ribbon domain containing protein [unclassified Chryseobacterium]